MNHVCKYYHRIKIAFVRKNLIADKVATIQIYYTYLGFVEIFCTLRNLHIF